MGKLEKVKKHLKDNAKTYLIGAGCVIVGVVATALYYNHGQSGQKIVNIIAPVFNNDNSSSVSMGGYTHKIVKNLDTGEIWESVKEAAEAAGVTPAFMSRHLNGHTDNVSGQKFSIIGLGAGI